MVYGTRFTRSFIPVLCMVVVIVDMVAMFHIILLWNYPYVIPTFHVVIIHRLFFSWWVYGYRFVGVQCFIFII